MSVHLTHSNQDLADLEPIEKASISELQELQLNRLQWSVEHAYNNVPCLLYTSPSPRDLSTSRMPSSA